jgi:hypothetical protein
LLRQEFEAGFTRVDAVLEVGRLWSAADAHAIAELQALFVLVFFIGDAFAPTVHAMSAPLAIFDVAAANGHRDGNSQQASQNDHS